MLFALAAAFVTFQLPSHTIGCTYNTAAANIGPPVLRCDVRSGLKPTPRAKCELDWTGISMRLRSRATPTCAGDTALDRRSRVLAYGKVWTRDGLRCISRRTGLTCTNRVHHGFFLSRQRWRVF